MKKQLFIAFLFSTTSIFCQNAIDNQTQISNAIKAAPQEEQNDCSVLGYDASGELVYLRKGKNKTICLADDPNTKGFNVSCYHQDLEPFMARGRELKKEGKSFKEIFDTREAEAKSGDLLMPKTPVTLHILSGDSAENATYRWVVYIPYATAESTGLPLKPIIPGAPWIMDPGTHRAHIMISPPNN